MMANAKTDSLPQTNKIGILLAFRFAMRELRGGLTGFYVFLACIALGVGAISGVNSVSQSITQGIAVEGQALLGGDASFSVFQRDIGEKEAAFLNANGKISKSMGMRAMARMPDGSDQSLIELKSVDENYPLYGKLTGASGEVAAGRISSTQAIADQLLLDRLGLKIGDSIKVGKGNFTIFDTITNEPDRISEGLGFGPKVIISPQAMIDTGLIQPGSLVRYTYRLKMDDASPSNLGSVIAQAKNNFSETGWRIRSRNNAAPALSRNIERFSQFLTLVGLTALIVGGVGVANAIRAFLETKRPVIATFKSLGASGRLIFQVYLIQIMALATIGTLAGLVLGALAPPIAAYALSGLIPVTNASAFYPDALILGAVFGLLTAFTFAVWPLGLSRETPATALFRSAGYSGNSWPRPSYIALQTLCLAALVGLAFYVSENREIAFVFIGAIAFSFLLLRLVAIGIQRLAKAAPQMRSVEWRMAIANIHRPGALTNSVVISLGLGLALLVALAQIDGNLRQRVSGNLPAQAPDFFFVDVQNHEIENFKSKLLELSPEAKVVSVPMLRGRVTKLKGVEAEKYPIKKGGEWVLRGDRGITYAKNIPENSTLSAGKWWPADYSGTPLVSFSAEEAGELDLGVGDIISVNVLGRTIEAEIASLRNVEWESMGINFVLVFSPNTFAGAPHSYLSTLITKKDDKSRGEKANQDGRVLSGITKAFPSVTSVRVRDALDTVNRLIGQLSTAIRAAASVALIASVLVLGGALAAGNRARVHDSVVLKTLGATRKMLVRTFVYEYALLGLATAIFALVAGGVASWFVVANIMQFPSNFIPEIALITVVVALVFTVGFGLIGTWRILGQKTAPVLREL